MWTVVSASGIPCISMSFEEAHNNPAKTYPYPSGVALVGTHEDMTPEVVHKAAIRMWNNGMPRRWARIVKVSDGVVEIKKSRLNSLKAGFGIAGPKVSVVALLFDKDGNDQLYDTCVTCIDRVLKHSPKDCEIVLVCNGPSQKLLDHVRWIEKIDPRVVSVSTGQNVGVVAKNFGYNLARGKYIISIDSDVFTESGWVEKIVDFLDKHPKVGLCAPCGGRLRVDKWGPDVWPCGQFAEGPCSIFGYEDAEYFGNQTTTGKDGVWLDVAPSMCWGFRRELLSKIGYLDWRFGPFVGSDADFCMRVKKADYSVELCRVPIRHMGCGGSTHAMFSDLENLRVDHVKELRKRWYQHAHKLCGLFPQIKGYVPPPKEEKKDG
jgi:GT2 family glycosyltransferase